MLHNRRPNLENRRNTGEITALDSIPLGSAGAPDPRFDTCQENRRADDHAARQEIP
jgi:hypothetical protein